MAKFVKSLWRLSAVVLALAVLGGCAGQIPYYIQAKHPYERKMYGNYDKIADAARQVLVRNGWPIQRVTDASVFERTTTEGEDTEKDILIFTGIRKHWMVIWPTYTRLNVFVHPTAEGANVDLRWAKVTPFLIKFQNFRNDALAKRLLEQMEEELTIK